MTELFNWAGNSQVRKILESLGYSHLDTIPEESIWVVAEKLSNAGLNVMIAADKTLLAVDNMLFRQR